MIPYADFGYFALTQTETKQKAFDIRRACRILGFPQGAVAVAIINA